jgi:hypothetical protein
LSCNTAKISQPHVSVLLKPDFSRSLTTYSWQGDKVSFPCVFSFERAVNLPLLTLQTIKAALALDPWFLERNQLDLMDSRADQGEALATAASALLAREQRQSAGRDLIRQQALMPFVQVDSWSPWRPGADSDDRMRAVRRDLLATTADGIRDLQLFRQIDLLFENVRTPNVLPTDVATSPLIRAAGGVPTPLIDSGEIGAITTAYTPLLQKTAAAANAQAAQIVSSIPSGSPSSWSFGIGIGIGGPVPLGGITFSIGNFSVGLDFSGPSLPSVVPSWMGAPIPLNPPQLAPAARSSRFRSAYRALAEGLLARPAAPDGGGTIETAITNDTIPPVIWTPGELAQDNPAGRKFLAGLLARALPAMSDEEKALVADALKQPSFPADVANLVAHRADQGLEIQKLQDKEWYPTHIELAGLLPAKRPGQPCPVTGCIDLSDSHAVDAYLDEFNKRARQSFQAQVAAARQKSPNGKPFASDLPAMSLTYGNDFRFLLTTYTWDSQNGPVTLQDLERTPPFIVDQVRNDPTGHVYERWILAASNALNASSPNAPPSEAAELFQKSFIDEFAETVDHSLGLSDALYPAFVADVEAKAKAFWDTWSAQRGSNNTAPYQNPFVPPYPTAPMLKFFDPPWQHEWEDGMTFEQWVIYEQNSPFTKLMLNGQIIPPTPIVN